MYQKNIAQPVNNFPRIRQVGNDLDIDKYLLLDVDDADHLVQVFSSVSKELFYLQICLELVKLFHLSTGMLLTVVRVPTCNYYLTGS